MCETSETYRSHLLNAAKPDFASIDFDVVEKVTAGRHLYLLKNQAQEEIKSRFILGIHLIYSFFYALFLCWINET